jgi:cytidylate kinase
MIVTIDGPAGAGKSTIAKALAKRLGWRMLDTGAMYRAVTWKALQEERMSSLDGGIDPLVIAEMIRTTDLLMEPDGRVLCDGFDVSSEIRTPSIAQLLKPIADSPECRAELVKKQQYIGSLGNLVTEGRDQGSVVFPHAEFKFYLDASVDERAKRRHKQEGGDLETVKQAVIARDTADRSRPVGALVVPKGAINVDTTDMTIDQTVDLMYVMVKMLIKKFAPVV